MTKAKKITKTKMKNENLQDSVSVRVLPLKTATYVRRTLSLKQSQ